MPAKNSRRRKKQKQILLLRELTLIASVAVFVIVGVVFLVHAYQKHSASGETAAEVPTVHEKKVPQPALDVELLSYNEYSRPGIALNEVNGIVIHYTANPGTEAMQNRDYFEGLKDSHITKASAHFVIGIDGTIVQCIPTAEIAYASNERNTDTVAIECCHFDETGQFTEQTYASLVELTAFLMGKFDLTTDQVIRHYDITGKLCPLYFVEHEDAWEQFRRDVDAYIEENGVEDTNE